MELSINMNVIDTIGANQIWEAALGELQLKMTRATFDTWFRQTYVVDCQQDTFIIGTPTTYAKEWLENRHAPMIKRTVSSLVGRSIEMAFLVRPRQIAVRQIDSQLPLQAAPLQPEVKSEPKFSIPRQVSQPLNSRYTFESFIVGAGNRLAHAAAMAVAERPSHAYNPFFIYGGVGLGKTHLLNAIGHTPSRRGLTVVYVTSETFTNEMINAIRTQTTEDFRNRYRNVDVLLIDDIQFIAGKDSTQEEFFHTFNALHTANKQIVISSDRPPRAIGVLDERLRSRFEWGLIADVQAPDLETRIAILQAKAAEQKAAVPQDVLEYIARKVQSNIRELEGALTRTFALSQLLLQPLTVEMAQSALQDIVGRQKNLSLEDIIDAVAVFYGLSHEEMTGRSRAQRVSMPRQVAMYIMREETSASLPDIGGALGGRDHTTIIHGVEKIHSQVEIDDKLRKEILQIREQLYARRRHVA